MSLGTELERMGQIERIVSDKDVHFAGAIIQNAEEQENLTGLNFDRYQIEYVSILCTQQLLFEVHFHDSDRFANADYDLHGFLSFVTLDLPVSGVQIAGAGPFMLDVDLAEAPIPYIDTDESNELHVSLVNRSAVAKAAIPGTDVVLKFGLRPRAPFD